METNHPDNLIELTVEEHAEAHKQLWLMNRDWQDEVAYLTLSQQISIQEAIRKASRNANLGNRNAAGTHKGNSRAALGITRSSEQKKKISATLKVKGIRPPTFTGHHEDSKKAIGAANAGTRFINNGSVIKKLKPGQSIPDGFTYGMRIT